MPGRSLPRSSASASAGRGPAANAVAAESKDTGKIAAMLEMWEAVTKKRNKIVDKFQTSKPNLAKQQCYGLNNQKLLMKEIRRLRKSNKKDVKKARGALTRVGGRVADGADSPAAVGWSDRARAVALKPLPGWFRLRLQTWVALATTNGQARE